MIKGNLHFDHHSIQFDFFLSSQCFLKEVENMFSMFLSSYKDTLESLGELKKFSQTSTQVSIKQLDFEVEISITC